MKYIDKFHKMYPNIEIRVVNQLTDVLVQELRNGNLDIVIMATSSQSNIKDLKLNSLTDLNDILQEEV